MSTQNSNSIAIVDREIADGTIEGVNFGPRIWVIARSPAAMLIWIFGHSWSVNGHQRYAQPHLTILPDRSPKFIYNPRYVSLRHDWTRLNPDRLTGLRDKIEDVFGGGALSFIKDAVRKKKTVLFEGGGGPLPPKGLYGHARREWVLHPGNGFITVPEGMKPHDMYRRKLGWKPAESTT